MRPLLTPAFVCLLLGISPLSAHAGLWSLLGKAGKAASSAGKVGAKAAKGAKVAKVAGAGKAAVGITGAVAAERAVAAMAGMGDDAARSAGYLARTAEGELVMVSKSGTQTTFAESGLAAAVDDLGGPGVPKTIYLDKSTAASTEALAALPEDTRLVLVDEGKHLPVRREPSSTAGEAAELLVDTASGAVDLSAYVEESDEDPAWLGFATKGLMVLAGVWFLWWLKTKLFSPTPVAS